MAGIFVFLSRRLLIYWLVALQLFQPMAAHAQTIITPDQNAAANNRPVVAESANHTPVENIAPVSAGGVSHNALTDFQVGQEGVIINNSASNGVSTIGGVVLANPNLHSGQEARIILNEVTGTNPTNQEGYTEIFGKKAEYIVANPNGISCNGCGFINTPKVVLTTGKPTFDANGTITSINVEKGTITVGGAGMDVSTTDSVDIISRAAEINATIWGGKSLNITAGQNQYDYATGSVTPLAAESASDALKPVVAIDASQLGSMYAGKITLKSTESGVGVNSLGEMVATSNDVTINADGTITYGTAQAANDIHITSQNGGITQQTGAYAGKSIALHAKGPVNVSGQYLYAENGNVTIDTENDAMMDGSQAGESFAFLMANQVALHAGGSVLFSHVSSSGHEQVMDINAGTNLGFDTSTLAAGTFILQSGLATHVIDSVLVSQNDLLLNAADFALSNSTLLAVNDLTMNVSGNWQNNLGVITSEHQTAIHAGGALVNNGELSAHSSLNLEATDITNSLDGYMAANGDVQMSGTSFLNRGHVQTLGSLAITASGDVTLIGSLLSLGQTDIGANTLLNQGGSVQAGSHLLLTAQNISNASGLFYSERDLNANASSILNDGGEWASLGATTLTASTGLTNQHEGVIHSNSSLTLLSQGEIDNSATLVSSGLFIIEADTLNQSGTLYTLDGMELTIHGTATNSGTIQSEQSIILQSQSLHNTGAVIASNLLTVSAIDLINAQNGLLGSLGDLTLQTTNLTNTQGTLYTEGFLTLTAHHVNNNQGTIIASALLQPEQRSVQASQFTIDGTITNNAGTISIAHNLHIDANAIDNSSGTMVVGGSFVVSANHFNNQQGITSTGVDINIQNLDNRNGLMEAGGLVHIINDTIFENENGTVQSYGSNGNGLVSILANQDINNQGGSILALGNIDLTVNDDYTITGDVQSSGTVDITAHNIINSGSLQSEGSVVFNASGYIENQSLASLLSNDTMDLLATGAITNYGEISSANGLNLTSGSTITNGLDALMTTGGPLAVSTSSDLINQGRISSLLDSSFTALNFTNNGQISSGGSITITTDNITNTSLVFASQNLNLLVENQLLNDQGTLAALDGSIIISNAAGGHVQQVHNLSGTIQSYNGDVSIQTDSLVNQRKALTFSTVTITDPLQPFSLQDYLVDAQKRLYTAENLAYKEAHPEETILLYINGVPYDDWTSTQMLSQVYNDVGSAGVWSDGYFVTAVLPLNYWDPNLTESFFTQYVNNLSTSSTYGVTMSHIQETATTDTGQSIISAGGNMAIDATSLLNDASTIASGGNLALTGTTLVNQGYDLSKTDRLTCNWTGPCLGYHPENEGYFRLNLPSMGSPGSQVDLDTGIYQHIPSLITAGGSITGTFSGAIDNVSIVQNTALPDYYPQVGLTSYNNATLNVPGTSQTDMYHYIQTPQGQTGLFVLNGELGTLSQVGRLEDQVEGAFVHNFDGPPLTLGLEASGGSPGFNYAIETNVDYINVDAYLGSEYLLNLIGFNPDHMITLLGDPFYETSLIEKVIMDKLGKRFIASTITNSTQQMQYLMDNAAAAMVDLELVPGVALSSEQLAALHSDIIWPVQQVVNNQIVWVPTLYLSANSLAGIEPSGAIISSGHATQLTSGSNLSNLGGKISGGSLINLTSTNGSILNKASVVNTTIGNNTLGYLANQGNITSGGSVLLNAASNIHQVGSLLHAEGDLQLLAGNDITLETAQVSNELTGAAQKGGLWIEDKLVNVGSDITANGNAIVKAGHDFTVSGSTLDVGGSAAIDAAHDTTITSVLDANYSELNINSGHKKYLKQIFSTENVAANLLVGENLYINTPEQGSNDSLVYKNSHDVSIIGSNVLVGGNTAILAANDINILPEQESGYLNFQTSKKGFLSSSKSKTNDIWVNQAGSYLDTSGDLTLISGGNTSIIASDVFVGGDAAIQTGLYTDSSGTIHENQNADLTISSATDVYSHSYAFQKKKIGLSSPMNILGGVVAGAIMGGPAGVALAASSVPALSFKGKKEATLNETQASSTLYVGGNLTTHSLGDTAIIASNIIVDGDASMVAGLVTDSNGNDHINSNSDLLLLSGQDLSMEATQSQSGKLSYSPFAGLVATTLTGNPLGWAAGLHGKYTNHQYDGITMSEVPTYLSVGGSFTGQALGDIGIVASEIHAVNDITLTAGTLTTENGTYTNANSNVTILAGHNVNDQQTKDLSVKLGWSSTLSPTFIGVGWGLTGAYDHVEDHAISAVPSILEAGHNVNINATHDISLVGSQVFAGNDANFIAGHNLNILADNDASDHDEQHFAASLMVTYGISSQVSEAITAINNISKLGSLNPKASLSGIKDLMGGDFGLDGKEQLINDGFAMHEGIVGFGQLGEFTSNIAGTLQGTKSLADFANGMATAGVGFSANASYSASDSHDQTAYVSSITAGHNLTMASGNDTTIIGAHLSAGNDMTLAVGHDLTITAAQNHSEANSIGASFSTNIGLEGQNNFVGGGGTNAGHVNIAGWNSPFSPQSSDSFGLGGSFSNYISTSYTNATLSAGNHLQIDVGHDATIKGANIHSNTAAVNVAGNLTIASLQDTEQSGDGSASVDFMNGKLNGTSIHGGYTDKAWVGNQTSLVTDRTLTMNIGQQTNIIGALINSHSNDLTLTTGSLIFSDLFDHDVMKSGGAGISGITSFGKDKQPKSGDSNYGETYHGDYTAHNIEQTTHATIGLGTITVAGTTLSPDAPALDGLNRDPEKAQEITKVVIIDPIKIDYTDVNNWGQLVDDIGSVKKNAAAIADKLGTVLTNGGKTPYEKSLSTIKNDLVLSGKMTDKEAADLIAEANQIIANGCSISQSSIMDFFISNAYAGPNCTASPKTQLMAMTILVFTGILEAQLECSECITYKKAPTASELYGKGEAILYAGGSMSEAIAAIWNEAPVKKPSGSDKGQNSGGTNSGNEDSVNGGNDEDILEDYWDNSGKKKVSDDFGVDIPAENIEGINDQIEKGYEEAQEIYDEIDIHDLKDTFYKNRGGELPKDGVYIEIDIPNDPSAKNRGTHRIIIDKKTGQGWYTPDHYGTFIKLK
ncbi:MAG: hemagglutinin repeat-containing protein [Alphaproteobacteria bacterium]|nr:hemagglutinin repeat-containing protein [Alphaproteobacteria bacterium]